MILYFIFLIVCHFIPAIAAANGQVPTLKKMPQAVSNREQLQKFGFIDIDVSGIFFGKMSIEESHILLDKTFSFDINKLTSSYTSVFSRNGFVCNVKINSLKEETPAWSDVSTHYAADSTFKTDCLKEYSKLPKYAAVAYIHPALDVNKVKRINTAVPEGDRLLIKRFVPSAIKEFLNNPNMNVKNETTTITKIGEKGQTNQYFVMYTGGYSFVLAIKSGEIALQRIDNGVLSIDALIDINSDGLVDAFVLSGSMPAAGYTYGYRIIFDGKTWSGGLISTPM